MEGYLGDFPVDISTTEFKDYTPQDWVLSYIYRYGQIDGEHHKTWVLDQVVQLLNGTPVILTEARWANGHTELRYTLGEPSEKYLAWVKEYKGEDEEEYGYDEGIPP